MNTRSARGEPGSGWGLVQGRTMAERQYYCLNSLDLLRRLMLPEPRGHHATPLWTSQTLLGRENIHLESDAQPAYRTS